MQSYRSNFSRALVQSFGRNVCKALMQSFGNFDGKYPAFVVVFAVFDHKRHVIFRQLLSFLRCLGTFAGEFLAFALQPDCATNPLKPVAQLVSKPNYATGLSRSAEQSSKPLSQLSHSASRLSFTPVPAPCDASSQCRRACQRCQQCRKPSKSPSREHQS